MTDNEKETLRKNMLNPNLKVGDVVGYIGDTPITYEGQWGDYITLDDKKETNDNTKITA